MPIHCRLAADLNCNFHDTIQEKDVDWISPITMLRLPWNMHLCFNWLELLHWQITEFEHHFHVLCHYPLKKEVVALVHKVHMAVSQEAKWLTKACIIVAQGIFFNENTKLGRCYLPRKNLQDTLNKLAPVMRFLKEDAYKILHYVLQTCWTESEQQNGHARKRERINIKEVYTFPDIPDIDEAFDGQHRSIYFWLSSNPWPDIENGRKDYVKTVEIISNYLRKPAASMNSTTPTVQIYKIDHDVFESCANAIVLKYNRMSNGDTIFASKFLDMLLEDGWLTKDVYTKFFTYVGIVMNQDKTKNPYYDSLQDLFSDLEEQMTTYLVLVFMMGDTWEYQVPHQTMLAMMLRSQCRAMMTNLGCYVSCLVQRVIPNQVPCPAPHYFSKAQQAVMDRCGFVKPELNLNKAHQLVATLSQPIVCSLVDTNEALEDVEVPEMDELTPELVSNWIAKIRSKREQLLQLVVNTMWINSQRFSQKLAKVTDQKPAAFPCLYELEFRFVEEISGLYKALQISQSTQMYRLMELLAVRFSYLQLQFVNWSEITIYSPVAVPMQTDSLNIDTIAVKLWMLEANIPLRAIFEIYLSKDGTINPINVTSADLLQDLWFRLFSISCDESRDMSLMLQEYIDTLWIQGSRYLTRMLQHCIIAWKLPSLGVWELDETQLDGSLKHANHILRALTQLAYIMIYNLLLLNRPNVISRLESLTNQCVRAWVTVLVGQLEPEEQWKSNTIMDASSHFLELWYTLAYAHCELRMANISVISIPGFSKDMSPLWNSWFNDQGIEIHNFIFAKLQFAEFFFLKSSHIEETVLDVIRSKLLIYIAMANHNIKSAIDTAESGPSSASAMPEDEIAEDLAAVKLSPKEERGVADGTEEQPSNLVYCSGCARIQGPKMKFMVCSQCRRENWSQIRTYCSKRCQGVDWKKRHSAEHKTYSKSSLCL